MSDKILTISIAAYNVESYIKTALDSLIDKRIIDDLEVFVIDDGGTDRTLEIAKKYATMYPNSIFAVHKENGGYGTTVNYSIDHATGKYFKLLDGDDWFDKNGLYQLVFQMKNCDEDLIITPFFRGNPSKKMKAIGFPNAQWGKRVPINEINSAVGMWSIAYKTQLLRSNGLVLPEHLLYTDKLYATIPFVDCQYALFLNYYVYCHRLGREGQSLSRQSKIKNITNNLDNVERLCLFYVNEKSRKNFNLDYLLRRVAVTYCQSIKFFLLMPVSRDIVQKIKAYEIKTRKDYPDIYYKATSYGKMGKLLAVLRKTRYMAYWLLKLIPGGFPL